MGYVYVESAIQDEEVSFMALLLIGLCGLFLRHKIVSSKLDVYKSNLTEAQFKQANTAAAKLNDWIILSSREDYFSAIKGADWQWEGIKITAILKNGKLYLNSMVYPSMRSNPFTFGLNKQNKLELIRQYQLILKGQNVPVSKTMQNKTIHCLLALGLLLLGAVNLSAQYLPSPQDNPRWVMNIWSLGQFLDKEEIWTEPGTVTLEGKSWMPLTRVHHWNPNSSEAPPDPTPDTILLGYYRMEGAKVYFRNNSLEWSSLLRTGLIYDFALEAGDSLYALGPLNAFPATVLYRVHETGTFECNGEMRKWLRVNFVQGALYHESYWVQGFGDVLHPFIPGNCLNANCESMYMSQTLFLGGDSIPATFPNFPCVPSLSTNIQEIGNTHQNAQAALKVFPNPVSLRGVVHIQTMNGLPEDSYIVEFYASNGQLLHKSTKDIRQPVRLPDCIKTTGLYQLVVKNEQGMRYGAASLLVVD